MRNKVNGRKLILALALAGFVPASCAPGWLAGRHQQREQRTAERDFANVQPSERVRKAQSMLQALNYDPGPTDGILGPQTRGAIRDFQYENGIEVSGLLGERTFKELEAESQW